MKLILSSIALSLGLVATVLVSGCGDADLDTTEDSATVNSPLYSGSSNQNGGALVQLEPIGSPKWKPTDFHLFSEKYKKLPKLINDLLPEPHHAMHPDLGVGPGAPHAGPYTSELTDGVESLGYDDRSTFTPAQFKKGVILTWMTVPREDSPQGSSPDFDLGPIIPNTIFPIHVEIQYMRNGVIDPFVSMVDIPALDQSLDPPFNVDGHSHFPIFSSDASSFYTGVPSHGSYRRLIQVVDVTGEGWTIQVPFKVK